MPIPRFEHPIRAKFPQAGILICLSAQIDYNLMTYIFDLDFTELQKMTKNFQGHMWYLKEDNIYTVGINEDALENFEEITSLELPNENEAVDPDTGCGNLETDTEPLELFSPVTGTVIEVNSTVQEDPTLIQDDPYDSWLFKVESEEEVADDDEEDDEDEDEDDEDEDDEDWEEEEEED